MAIVSDEQVIKVLRQYNPWWRNPLAIKEENKPQKRLQEHRPILWNQMILSETLFPHLREIDETARQRLERMMPELMKLAGVTENLKTSDPMKWVGLMNACKAQAEETILNELVYN